MDFILMDVCRTGDVDRLNAAISEGVALTQKGTAGESLLVRKMGWGERKRKKRGMCRLNAASVRV
jgi:hypothetical protein